MPGKGCRLSSLLILALVLLPLHVNCGGDKPLHEQIDEIVQKRVEDDRFSGTVLVAAQGEILYSGAFGYADKDRGIRNTLDTRFNIGSIGKVFTGTLVMQLVQEGKISIADPLGMYLPDYPHEERDKIQIGHLLNHSSGLGNYMEHGGYKAKMHSLRRIDDLLPFIYEEKPRFEPGTEHSYSNSAMVLAGAVVEQVTGTSYADCLEKWILKPLEMENSGIVYPENDVPGRATGYERIARGSHVARTQDEPPAFSDGGLYSTAPDLMKFDRALCRQDLLEEKYKQIMFTPAGPDKYSGYGWGVTRWEGTLVHNHSGRCPGFNADFRRYPEKDLTLIVMSNYEDGSFDMTNDIEVVLLGLD